MGQLYESLKGLGYDEHAVRVFGAGVVFAVCRFTCAEDVLPVVPYNGLKSELDDDIRREAVPL